VTGAVACGSTATSGRRSSASTPCRRFATTGRGVFFFGEEEGDGECAWYSECADRRVAAGGDWSEDLTDEMDIALLCGSCFDTAKRIKGIYH
jgi:hypothetical protein